MKFFLSIFNNFNKKEKIVFYFVFLFILFIICLELLSLSLFLPLLSVLISDEYSTDFTNKYLDTSKINQILFFLVLICSIFVIKNIASSVLLYKKKKFLARIQIDFTSRIFNSYLHQRYNYFLKTDKSEIIRNIHLVTEYTNFLENFINFFIEFSILVGIIVIIYTQDYKVATFILFFAFAFIFVIRFILKNKLKKYGQFLNIYNEKIIKNYFDIFGSIKDIILQNKQKFFFKSFNHNISSLTDANVKNSFFSELPRYLLEVVVILLASILVYFLFSTGKSNDEILITLTFTMTLIFRAIPSVTRITYELNNFTFKIDLIYRVNKLLKEIVQKKEVQFEKTYLKKIDFEKINLKNIAFKYRDGDNYVFKDLSLEIIKNQSIGIIGSSGKGKSTLIDLITGMLYPNEGKILIDNNILNKENVRQWQSRIAYISQKNYLLNASIKDNIAFGEDEIEVNTEKLLNSIKLSKLESLVNLHNEGLNFIIGEDGKNISGGQRQRIILARSLYRESDILIFDEATTALDKMTENEILEDIKKNFYGNKTIVFCTHNHNLLNFCDQIIDIDNLNNN